MPPKRGPQQNKFVDYLQNSNPRYRNTKKVLNQTPAQAPTIRPPPFPQQQAARRPLFEKGEALASILPSFAQQQAAAIGPPLFAERQAAARRPPTVELGSNLKKYVDKIMFDPPLSDDTVARLFSNLDRTIRIASTEHVLTSLQGTDEWMNCPPVETKQLKELVDAETSSTLYMLRIISGSIITSEEFNKKYKDDNELPIKPYITFKIKSGLNESDLTGSWETDKKIIDLIVFKRTDVKMKTCLIMAFGPSASGKTKIGQSVVSGLHMCGKVQEQFLKIDGGDYRQLSAVYQNIIKIIPSKRILGFNNMHGEIFKAGKIKERILDYLRLQRLRIKTQDSDIDPRKAKPSAELITAYKTEYDIANKKLELEFNPDTEINLYVPDTAVSCTTTCASKIQEYNVISGNNEWIGLNIYQHLGLATGLSGTFFRKFLSDKNIANKFGMCTYSEDQYKCKTCKTSGEEREVKEGKKYDYSTYPLAILQGERLARTATRGWMIIHSCGGNTFKLTNPETHNEITVTSNNVIEKSTWNFDEALKTELAKFGLLFNRYTKLGSLIGKKNFYSGGKKTKKRKGNINRRKSTKRRKN
jgi:hypothetical protein